MTPANPEAAPPPASASLLSIGDVADATGIAPDTIRVWERRYGRPVPVRLPSGHRRYTIDHVRWLRRVAEALALGHRPSAIVHMPDAELDQLLFPEAKKLDDTTEADEIIRLAQRYARDEIMNLLRETQIRLGARSFVVDWVGPLLDSVGRAWADGKLDIRHEHFLTQLVEDALRELRKSITTEEGSPVIVLTTLSGELHGLGLQMIAILAALRGVSACGLGTHTPNPEIASAMRETRAEGLVLSVSLATGGVQTDRVIGDLRRTIDANTPIAVGGKGARTARRGPRGVDYLTDTTDFETWLDNLKPQS